MTIGMKVSTSRFGTVTIKRVFYNMDQARFEGYTEPTHHHEISWEVLGKTTSENHMEFAAVRKCFTESEILASNAIATIDDKIAYLQIMQNELIKSLIDDNEEMQDAIYDRFVRNFL